MRSLIRGLREENIASKEEVVTTGGPNRITGGRGLPPIEQHIAAAVPGGAAGRIKRGSFVLAHLLTPA